MNNLIKIIEGRFNGMPAKKTGRKESESSWVGIYDPETDERTFVTAGVALELIKGVVMQYPGNVLRLEHLQDDFCNIHYRDYICDEQGFRCIENNSRYYVSGEENIPGIQ